LSENAETVTARAGILILALKAPMSWRERLS